MASRGRRVGIIFIVLALILIIVLGAAAYFFKDIIFGNAAPTAAPLANNTPVPPAVKTVDIVVLTQNISFGQPVPEEALGFAPVPEDRYVEGLYFKTKEDVAGKRARYQLTSGTILTTGMVSANALGSYASGQIPPGYVAIPIPITMLTSVSYALQPGDHVSVLVALLLEELDPNFQSALPNVTGSVEKPGTGTTETGSQKLTITITNGDGSQGRTELDPILNEPVYVQPSEPQRPRIVTQLIISDAMVLGVGRFPKDGGTGEVTPEPTTQPQPGVTPTPGPTAAPAPDPDQVTLVVTPQDAVTLNYIMLNKGAKLNLVLRSAGDTKSVSAEAVTLQFLMDQYNIPFPSKLPYGLEPRIDSLDYNHGSSPSPITQPTPAPQ
jgi:Flp pilus assembly protein CpaB